MKCEIQGKHSGILVLLSKISCHFKKYVHSCSATNHLWKSAYLVTYLSLIFSQVCICIGKISLGHLSGTLQTFWSTVLWDLLNKNSIAYTSTSRYKPNRNAHTWLPKDMSEDVHSSTIHNSPLVGWMVFPYKICLCLNLQNLWMGTYLRKESLQM